MRAIIGKRILITGGAGFIGGNFIHDTLERHPEDTIICVDKLTYAGNMETLFPIFDHKNFHFERADIADAPAVKAIFEKYKPDVIINFAAESHVDRSIEDPGIFLTTNILGTQVLLDASREYYVPDRPGHDLRYAIDAAKIHKELGWVPETTFEDGLHRTIKWYTENRSWWENVLSGKYRDAL